MDFKQFSIRLVIYFRFQIRCTSQIHGVYSQKTEKTIDQERPKSTHTSSNSINLRHNNIPSDQYYYQDGDVLGKKDSLSVHVKGECSLFPVRCSTKRPKTGGKNEILC